MSNDILEILLKTIGDEIDHKDRLPESIQDEYNYLFSKNNIDISDILKKHTAKDAAQGAINFLLEIIFSSNKDLDEYKDKIKVRAIKTIEENTKSIGLNDKEILITIDSHILKYIWVMNKSLIYGIRYLNKEDNKQLFIKTFLHFASFISFEKKYIFPLPETPESKDISTYNALHICTKIQDIFILSHEIAHILIHDKSYNKSMVNVENVQNYMCNSDIPKEIYDLLEEEIMADEIALAITIKALKQDLDDDIELICSAIFLLMDYFLSLRAVYIRDPKNTDFTIWLHRSRFLKNKLYQSYSWKEFIFSINIVKHLEERLWSSSAIAAMAIEEVKKNINNDQA